MICFGGFELDPTQGLTRSGEEVHLTPKALTVLWVLAERAGGIVSKDEVFARVWPDTAVSDSALTSCIQELRHALGDSARRPRYIETVHRRGFRFVASISRPDGDPTTVPTADSDAPRPIVGRDGVLQAMRAALGSTLAGRRQIVFLTGAPGLGKTAIVNAFLGGETSGRVGIAGAACVEQYGATEAYRPLLEALTRLCRQTDGARIVATLAHCAPTWLAQLPSVQTPAQFAALQRRTAGATRDRMLRELTDAVETMTAQVPMILWLEDLHWADASTIDWIAAFAGRPDPARVLLIGTFRPAGLSPGVQALPAIIDGLRLKGCGREIELSGLDERAFAAFVEGRYPAAPGAEARLHQLAALMRAHTGGNPLFASLVLADLVNRRVLVEEEGGWSTQGEPTSVILGIPEDVSRVIERQLDRLDAGARDILRVASVVGVECGAATVSAGAGRSVADVDDTLGELARQKQFVMESGTEEWPDGTVAARFAFVHSLHREVLYARLSAARRAELHARVGLRLEGAYQDRTVEIASRLAAHFEEGHDPARAILYLQHAAHTSVRRSALKEAQRNFERGLSLLPGLPPSADRAEREIALRIGMGGVLMASQGWGAPEVESMYVRARELCRELGDTPQVFPALWGLWLFYWGRGSLEAARGLADDLFALAARAGDSTLLLQAHHALWATSFSIGDLRAAHEHASDGAALYEHERHFPLAATYGNHDAAVCARAFDARALALMGDANAAVHAAESGIAQARHFGHPFTLALALVFGAAVHQFLRNPAGAERYAAEAATLSREHSFLLVLAWAMTLEGWAAAARGAGESALQTIDEGLSRAQATGSDQFRTHALALAADARLRVEGGSRTASTFVRDALLLARRTGERFYEAELHRLDGEILAIDSAGGRRAAESAFLRTIEIAREQGANLLVLRGAVHLAWLRRGDPGFPAARAMVHEASARVVGDGGLPDLRDAARLLHEAEART